ncbi:MAG: ferritin-like domain-containing protein [Elusimicrobiales bacterium]|nr:ferritin-like domain-containing protein [Elusimicrobiales bacterium]
MEIFNNEFLQGLINEEFADYYIYKYEAEHFYNKILNGKEISNVFLEFSKDEIRHIERINKIFKTEIHPVKRIIPKIKNLRETLKMHIVREGKAIKIYKAIKELLLVYDNLDVDILDEIISEEEKHYNLVKKYLLLIK